MSNEAALRNLCNPHHLNPFDIYEKHKRIATPLTIELGSSRNVERVHTANGRVPTIYSESESRRAFATSGSK
jgi:hypothetical protein